MLNDEAKVHENDGKAHRNSRKRSESLTGQPQNPKSKGYKFKYFIKKSESLQVDTKKINEWNMIIFETPKHIQQLRGQLLKIKTHCKRAQMTCQPSHQRIQI